MLDTYTVSFFGHRQIENISAIEKRLDEIIRPLLLEKGYVEFLVGRDGEFDLLATSTVKRLKRSVRDDNSALVWVLPYATAEYRDYEAETTPPIMMKSKSAQHLQRPTSSPPSNAATAGWWTAATWSSST